MLGVLWASASRGATVKELRAAIGLTRERLEAAYAYLLAYPLLGLTVLRQGDEFQLVTSGQVAASVERHLNAPRPVSLSGAAMQVLTIVAYRQPVSQAGIESVRGTSSDSAIGTLLQRQLIALDEHRLFTTTPPSSSISGCVTWPTCLHSQSVVFGRLARLRDGPRFVEGGHEWLPPHGSGGRSGVPGQELPPRPTWRSISEGQGIVQWLIGEVADGGADQRPTVVTFRRGAAPADVLDFVRPHVEAGALRSIFSLEVADLESTNRQHALALSADARRTQPDGR